VLIAAIHREWGELQGNYDELRFFAGLRPSEEIALVVTDYDRRNGVLSVTKARVNGIDQDVTKTRAARWTPMLWHGRCCRRIAFIIVMLRMQSEMVPARWSGRRWTADSSTGPA
jgi:hypothetical protein